jgi:ThiF family
MFVTLAAHVGFGGFTLCDGDTLEEANLNRYIVATCNDIGRMKVCVLSDYLSAHAPGVVVDAIGQSFPNANVERSIKSADIVIGCVDDVLPRLELDIMCRHFGKILIDLGAGFVVDDRSAEPVAAGGQVLISRPNGPCLQCLGFSLEMNRHTYFIPQFSQPEPSSLLINSMVACLGVECAISASTQPGLDFNRVSFDRASLSVVTDLLPTRIECSVCGNDAQAQIQKLGDIEHFRNSIGSEGIRCKTL